MVARINTSKSISKALNYNEQKVQQGRAKLLQATNFIKDANQLSFYDKITHFERLTSLNEAAAVNTVHISLSFHPTEHLKKDKLTAIANTYMEGIGFANQPYLIYEHHDAAHPHIHIVSTNIQWDGSRISMHNLGRNQSEKTRKEIESHFGLIKANRKAVNQVSVINPVEAQKVLYGKSATRQAIANVLQSVINQYNYKSLEQLNAILKLYNVIADRGEAGSRIFKHKGLQYHILDVNGKKIGVPIKASSFHMQPILKMLESRFQQNDLQRHMLGKRIKVVLDWALQKKYDDLPSLIRAVERENISVVLRQNMAGLIYGITFIDHKEKCVFNGSEIGKAYSAKAILAHCHNINAEQPVNAKAMPLQTFTPIGLNEQHANSPASPSGNSIAEILFESEQAIDFVPNKFKKKKRKKRRRMN
jgi:hypothetical protein